MRVSESLAVAYFSGLTLVAWLRAPLAGRRRAITLTAACACAAIVATALAAPALIRDWAPAASILVGYFFSGLLVTTPSVAFERWLMNVDRRWLGEPSERFAAWPAPLVAFFEITYAGCFVLLPAGFAALAAIGRSDLADRYWTMVLASEFACFAPLAFIQSRPPWQLERGADLADRAVHDVTLDLVQRFTIRANTFPSGHVAGSLTIALAIIGPAPAAGAVFLVLAISIGLACVVGRYHYCVDVAAGAAVSLAIWSIAAVIP
ncbi:MAG TPA: phosphatase PAP2 family protein [Vicinamibacterales bacterium]|nr:phosphatase PAP2 family protein [Vicinamibacterales bacterium]